MASPAGAACLTTPAPSNVITSTYGWRFHPVFKRWRLHRGADFRAQLDSQGVGVPLVAAEDGVVQLASSASGGNELRIVGADGTIARYLHLTRATVRPGDQVSAGQNVAISGGTGEASAAPHLHFEVYENGKHDVNPESMLCTAATHKSGADQVSGFPILACNPDGGQSCSGSPPPPATTSGGSVAVDSSAPTAPTTGAWDDMSTIELITSEVYKRFGNADWYKETAERPSKPLLQDYQHMVALSNYIELRRRETAERIEQLWAAKVARDTKREMRDRLDRQRAVANRSTPGT
ncbi:MAG: M23 family metallopeptidase [Burkholderiaceae bacterium]|nr:MAG: M23 family metallopeptidase [Burkholderiaceae bacterium]